jgi:hypothetical protein
MWLGEGEGELGAGSTFPKCSLGGPAYHADTDDRRPEACKRCPRDVPIDHTFARRDGIGAYGGAGTAVCSPASSAGRQRNVARVPGLLSILRFALDRVRDRSDHANVCDRRPVRLGCPVHLSSVVSDVDPGFGHRVLLSNWFLLHRRNAGPHPAQGTNGRSRPRGGQGAVQREKTERAPLIRRKASAFGPSSSLGGTSIYFRSRAHRNPHEPLAPGSMPVRAYARPADQPLSHEPPRRIFTAPPDGPAGSV